MCTCVVNESMLSLWHVDFEQFIDSLFSNICYKNLYGFYYKYFFIIIKCIKIKNSIVCVINIIIFTIIKSINIKNSIINIINSIIIFIKKAIIDLIKW
jgi:hypothetical protein